MHLVCTLIALVRCVEGAPLVIAANRDEYLDRPAAPPAVASSTGGRPVVAPRDLRAGGTWLGINDARLFVGLTNRPVAALDPFRPSRGQIVLDALDAPSAREAAELVAALPADAFNPFNLFLADERDAFAVVYETAPRVETLAPGVHVVGNADPDDRAIPKIARLLDRAEAARRRPGDGLLDALAEICRGHENAGRPREDACIHLGGYGTRSSMLLRLSERTSEDVWRWADGAPCSTSYENVTDLLHSLGRERSATGGGFETRAHR